MDPPSDQEIEHAADAGREVVAISWFNNHQTMFLKLLCRNGDDAVVRLDAYMVDQLRGHLERILTGSERMHDQSIRTSFLTSDANSLGIVPRDLQT